MELAIACAKEFKRLRRRGGHAVAKLDGAGDSSGKSTSTKDRLLSFELSSMPSAGVGAEHRKLANVAAVSTGPALSPSGPSEPISGRGVVGADWF